ncbi:hypothetical protein B0O99DRAFT_693956 [Bisporella sp. PMI_857]|nr:hypothetical protein B0O99DRAFT_693956 [Bisporella sp. PMI_857]
MAQVFAPIPSAQIQETLSPASTQYSIRSFNRDIEATNSEIHTIQHAVQEFMPLTLAVLNLREGVSPACESLLQLPSQREEYWLAHVAKLLGHNPAEELCLFFRLERVATALWVDGRRGFMLQCFTSVEVDLALCRSLPLIFALGRSVYFYTHR